MLACAAGWMCAEEGFIGVDVSDAGEGGLVEEERFDGAVRMFASVGKIAHGDGEGVGAEGGPAVLMECAFGGIGGEAAEAAGIDEEQLGVVVDEPDGVGVGGERVLSPFVLSAGLEKAHGAGHSELNAEGAAVGGVDGELLALAGEGGDLRAGEEIARGGFVRRAESIEGIADVGAAERDGGDGATDERREGEACAFDFGEFGHRRELQSGRLAELQRRIVNGTLFRCSQSPL